MTMDSVIPCWSPNEWIEKSALVQNNVAKENKEEWATTERRAEDTRCSTSRGFPVAAIFALLYTKWIQAPLLYHKQLVQKGTARTDQISPSSAMDR